MPHGAPPDIGFAYARHGNCREHPGVDADLFEGVLHGKRVHDGRQHAHIVGACPVEALGRRCEAAKDIAAAHDETQFMTRLLGRRDLTGDPRDRIGIDADLPLPHQHFAGELEQYPVETRASHLFGESPVDKRSGAHLSGGARRCQARQSGNFPDEGLRPERLPPPRPQPRNR